MHKINDIEYGRIYIMAGVITTVRSVHFNCGNVFTGEQSRKAQI